MSFKGASLKRDRSPDDDDELETYRKMPYLSSSIIGGASRRYGSVSRSVGADDCTEKKNQMISSVQALDTEGVKPNNLDEGSHQDDIGNKPSTSDYSRSQHPFETSEDENSTSEVEEDSSSSDDGSIGAQKPAVDDLIGDSFWAEKSTKRNASLWHAEEAEKKWKAAVKMRGEADGTDSESDDSTVESDSDAPVVVRDVEDERLKARFQTTCYDGAIPIPQGPRPFTAYAEYAARRDARLERYLNHQIEFPGSTLIVLSEADQLHLFKRNIIEREFGRAEPVKQNPLQSTDQYQEENAGIKSEFDQINCLRDSTESDSDREESQGEMEYVSKKGVKHKGKATLVAKKHAQHPHSSHFPGDKELSEKFDSGWIPLPSDPCYRRPANIQYLPWHSDYTGLLITLRRRGYSIMQIAWLFGNPKAKTAMFKPTYNFVWTRIDRFEPVTGTQTGKSSGGSGSSGGNGACGAGEGSGASGENGASGGSGGSGESLE